MDKSKRKRFLTIVIMPGDAASPKQYRLSQRTFKAGKIVVALLAVVVAYVLVDYAGMVKKVSSFNTVKQENTSQKIELQALSTKMEGLETRLSKLKLFDKKLRIIANIEEPAYRADGEHTGMGGADSDGDYFMSLEEKRGRLVANMHSNMDQLELEAKAQEKRFTQLQEFLMKQSSMLASTPSVRPARGWMTSSYGKRTDPFTGRRRSHNGLDIANRVGTNVIAPGDGVVTRVTRLPSLGKLVEISHGYGVKTLYGHLSKTLVKVGQKIKRGDNIAAMGNTGRSTGPHLHYEVKVNGVHVNPSRYILN